eukprot:3829066-Pyramimonas_sp.AAC.1
MAIPAPRRRVSPEGRQQPQPLQAALPVAPLPLAPAQGGPLRRRRPPRRCVLLVLGAVVGLAVVGPPVA